MRLLTQGSPLAAGLKWLEVHSGMFFGFSLFGVLVAHAWLWQKDRKRAARFQTRVHQDLKITNTPKISFLLPAWNEVNHLSACLDSILRLDYPNTEVVVCAGGIDGTLEVAKRYQDRQVVVLEQHPGEGKQKSLQKCFMHSTGEIIFLTDADSRLDTESFLATIQPIIAGEEVACTGSRRPLLGQESSPLVVYQWAYHRYLTAAQPDYIDTLYGINAAVHRSALEKIGAFRTSAPIGTDLLMGQLLLSAGYKIRFVSNSTVYTDYQSKISPFIRQQARWFRNRFIIAVQNKKRADLFSYLRIGLSAGLMLAIPLTGGFGLKALWYVWTVGLFHLLLSQMRVLAFVNSVDGKDNRQKFITWFFLPYQVISWLASARGIFESILPALRGNW